MKSIANEPDNEKTCLMSYANNKDADQPAHPRSLISAFVVRCLDSVMSLVSVTKISSLMLASVAEKPVWVWPGQKLPKTRFLMTRLKYKGSSKRLLLWNVNKQKWTTKLRTNILGDVIKARPVVSRKFNGARKALIAGKQRDKHFNCKESWGQFWWIESFKIFFVFSFWPGL